jgi:SPP1 gp7 family putative phage head morphogenesis protein
VKPQQTLEALDSLENRWTEALVRGVEGRLGELVDYVTSGGGGLAARADEVPLRFRGIIEPLARDIYEARLALYLASLLLTRDETPLRLEFQESYLAVLFTVSPREALTYLLGKRIVTRAQFERLTDEQRFHTFTVSEVSEKKLLEDIRERILNALARGVPEAELVKELQELLPRFTRARVELIAHQNLRQSAMAGRFEQMWRTKSLLPFVQWKTMGDDRVRWSHAALHNQIWPLEQIPIWPPAGFNCRCWTIQLSPRRVPRGQRVIDRPGEYPTADGARLRVGNPRDIGTYSVGGRQLEFEFINRPSALGV